MKTLHNIREKLFAYAKTKAHISCMVETDQCLYFSYIDSTVPILLDPKFQASKHLQWLYSQVCDGPDQKP